jgi:hypothetical protein
MKHTRKWIEYTWTDYKTNIEIANELNITPDLDKIQEYIRNWLQHINRRPHNRLPGILRKLQNNRQKKPFKRLLEAWDRNGSTSGQIPCWLGDDDDINTDFAYYYSCRFLV